MKGRPRSDGTSRYLEAQSRNSTMTAHQRMWCLKVINDIFKYPISSPFRKPVHEPGYEDVIESPMDFGTMRKKLQTGLYGSLDDFVSDFRLVCDNAMTYNGPTSIFAQVAADFKTWLERRLAKRRECPVEEWRARMDVIVNALEDHAQRVPGSPEGVRPIRPLYATSKFM